MTAELTDRTVSRLLIQLDRMLRTPVERMLANLRPAASDGTDAEGQELRELFAAARSQSDPALDGLAHKIEPVHDWTQIVLPEDLLAQLHKMCQQVVHRHQVLDEWGFGRRFSSLAPSSEQ